MFTITESMIPCFTRSVGTLYNPQYKVLQSNSSETFMIIFDRVQPHPSTQTDHHITQSNTFLTGCKLFFAPFCWFRKVFLFLSLQHDNGATYVTFKLCAWCFACQPLVLFSVKWTKTPFIRSAVKILNCLSVPNLKTNTNSDCPWYISFLFLISFLKLYWSCYGKHISLWVHNM